MHSRTPAAFVLVVLMLACAGLPAARDDEKMKNPTFDALVSTAQKHLEENYPYPEHPGTHPTKFSRPPQITRYDDHWKITWIIENPMTVGGSPIVKLDRKTLEVTSVVFTQ